MGHISDTFALWISGRINKGVRKIWNVYLFNCLSHVLRLKHTVHSPFGLIVRSISVASSNPSNLKSIWYNFETALIIYSNLSISQFFSPVHQFESDFLFHFETVTAVHFLSSIWIVLSFKFHLNSFIYLFRLSWIFLYLLCLGISLSQFGNNVAKRTTAVSSNFWRWRRCWKLECGNNSNCRYPHSWCGRLNGFRFVPNFSSFQLASQSFQLIWPVLTFNFTNRV